MSKINSLAVIYASEGTGHKSAAQAIGEAYLACNPSGHLLVMDILDVLPGLWRFLIAQSYTVMARYVPALWGASYYGTDKKSLSSYIFDNLHNIFCKIFLPRFLKILDENHCDAVVFTHYFGADITAKILKGKIPVYCCDTDFETHRFQRGRNFTASFCASEEALRQRQNDNITNVFITGIPVALKYKNLPSKETARSILGVPQDKKAVLVSGGGIGSGALLEAADSAANAGFYVLAVCGSNRHIHQKMSERFSRNDKVQVRGFVSDMENYFAACDAAVMKPGGLSSSEALCAGLPMLLINPVPGQEELNQQQLVSTGAALTVNDPNDAGAVLSRIFSDGIANKMHRAALAAAAPDAAYNIIENISKFSADCDIIAKL